MEKIGRLVAGFLLAAVGLTANTVAIATTYSVPGTNITAVITYPDTWVDTAGNFTTVPIGFAITRTSSDTLKNGEFEFNMAGSYLPGTVAGLASDAGASCSFTSTRVYCTIAADVQTVVITISVSPQSAFISYSWSVRPGGGTNSPAWLGESKSLTASGDAVAGATGQDTTVTAETTATDGLKGLLTAQGKSGTGSMFVSVQEIPVSSTACNPLFQYYVCIKFSADKSDGSKLKFPGDLADLLTFVVAANPTLTGLQGKSIKTIKLYYFSESTDTNRTALKNCTKPYSKSYSAVPCIESRSIDASTGMWIFGLRGWENGFVQVFD